MSDEITKNTWGLISLIADRLEKIDRRVNQNIFFQSILIAFSLYSFELEGKPLQQISENKLGFDAGNQVLEGIVVISFAYLLIRFGFLSATFLSIRIASKKLLDQIQIDTDPNKISLLRIFNTGNPLELILWHPTKNKRYSWSFFSIFTLLLIGTIIVLNNCCIYIYTHRITPIPYRLPILLFEFLVFIPFYLAFAFSREVRNVPLFSFASLLAPIVSVALYLMLIGDFKFF